MRTGHKAPAEPYKLKYIITGVINKHLALETFMRDPKIFFNESTFCVSKPMRGNAFGLVSQVDYKVFLNSVKNENEYFIHCSKFDPFSYNIELSIYEKGEVVAHVKNERNA